MPSRLEMLEQMIGEDAGDPFLLYALCLELYKAGRKKDALIRIEQLYHRHPDYLALYYQWALWLIEEGKTAEAKKATAWGIAVANKQNNFKIRSELQTLSDQI